MKRITRQTRSRSEGPVVGCALALIVLFFAPKISLAQIVSEQVPTATATFTATSTPTRTPIPTNTPRPTWTPMPPPTWTPVPPPTWTPTPRPVPTSTPRPRRSCWINWGCVAPGYGPKDINPSYSDPKQSCPGSGSIGDGGKLYKIIHGTPKRGTGYLWSTSLPGEQLGGWTWSVENYKCVDGVLTKQ